MKFFRFDNPSSKTRCVFFCEKIAAGFHVCAKADNNQINFEIEYYINPIFETASLVDIYTVMTTSLENKGGGVAQLEHSCSPKANQS